MGSGEGEGMEVVSWKALKAVVVGGEGWLGIVVVVVKMGILVRGEGMSGGDVSRRGR